MSVGQDPHRTHIGAAVIAIEIADLDPAVGGGVDERAAAQINAHMGDVAAAIGEEHQVAGQALGGGHPGEGIQLIAGPVGHAIAEVGVDVHGEAGAVKSAGGRAAPHIAGAQEGLCIVHQVLPGALHGGGAGIIAVLHGLARVGPDIAGGAAEGDLIPAAVLGDVVEPGHLALGGPPGENRKTIQIGIQALVRLVDAGEPLDGGAVEHDLVVDRLLDLRRGERHVLELTENIGELHADKLDLLVLYQTNDVFLGVTHAERSFSPPGGRGLLTLIKAVCFHSLTCVSSIAVLTDAFHSFYHRSRQKTRGFRS